MVECSVEYANLRNVRKDLRDSVNASDVHWIVKRCDVVAFFHLGDNFFGDEHTLIEFLAAVH